MRHFNKFKYEDAARLLGLPDTVSSGVVVVDNLLEASQLDQCKGLSQDLRRITTWCTVKVGVG